MPRAFAATSGLSGFCFDSNAMKFLARRGLHREAY